MCLTCGCGDDQGVRVTALLPHGSHATAAPGLPSAHGPAREHGDHGHSHGDHGHSDGDHGDEHRHPHMNADTASQPRRPPAPKTETLVLEEQILAKNDQLAEHTRGWLLERDITAVNLMSSPGAGKTSLLERTIAELAGHRKICVIEGDQETVVDAERIRAAGADAVQVNTGAGCHLDAPMVHDALQVLSPTAGSLLFVENVGNLVCPALFDLGERAKVVVISVTEGDDKPLKYPHMFAAADLVVINKTDLLPYVDFDVDRLKAHARSLRPEVEIIELSVRTGHNMDAWHGWLGALPTAAGAKH